MSEEEKNVPQQEESEVQETELNEQAEQKTTEQTELSTEEQLANALEEAAAYKDKWMRAAAEFDNFRKRNESTRHDAFLDGKSDILLKIFPIGDNLERALLSCDEQTKKGIEMVIRSYKKILEEEGIEEINPIDEEFDPMTSEAIMCEPAEEGVEAGYVKGVFLKGYKRGEKVLRFAQVKVTS